MRTAHAIALGTFLVVGGLVCALGRRSTLAILPATIPSTSAGLPQSPSPPALVPLGPGEKRAPSIQTTPTLGCIQDALGGAGAFAGVASLRIVGSTKPSTVMPRSIAKTTEIGVVFPDRYRRRTVQTLGARRSSPLTTVVGFNGRALLNSLNPAEDAAATMQAVNREFVRQIFMSLPRELNGVRLSQRTTVDGGHQRLVIDAFDPAGLAVTLLADSRTCIPVALLYSASSVVGSGSYRVELSHYRRFGGILFSTVHTVTKDGELYEEQYISEVQVDPPLDDTYFRR